MNSSDSGSNGGNNDNGSSGSSGSFVDLKEILRNFFGNVCYDESFPETAETKETACKLLRDLIDNLKLFSVAKKFACIKDLVLDMSNVIENGEIAGNVEGTVMNRFNIVVANVRAILTGADDGEDDNDYDKVADLFTAAGKVKYLEENSNVGAQFVYMMYRVIKEACDDLPEP